jgi:hypothetical protein
MQMLRNGWLKKLISCTVLADWGTAVSGFIAFWLYPGFDEAYYYVYSQNLDWSYFDHPVLVALVTGFGPWLTGEVSQFTIRLGTLILHTGSLLLLYLTSAKLFSKKQLINFSDRLYLSNFFKLPLVSSPYPTVR